MVVRQLTAKDRIARTLKAINQRCRLMRHQPLREQHQRLCRMLKGHFGYFGIGGNYRRLAAVRLQVQRLWRKWLSRRSWTSRLSWEQFRRVLARFPLPPCRIVHRYVTP